MNIAILLATALGLSFSAHAAQPDTLSVLPKLLANEHLLTHGFKAQRTKAQWVVTYCPDNTCDLFRAPASVDRVAIGDFSVLWLYYATGYIYLERFEKDARPLVRETLERYSAVCPPTSEEQTASCVLTGLAKSHRIRLAGRRSDEGQTGEWREGISEKLSAEAIRSTKLWQRNEWGKSTKP